jgi:hypothetical protein
MTVAKTASLTLCARAERSVNTSRPGRIYLTKVTGQNPRRGEYIHTEQPSENLILQRNCNTPAREWEFAHSRGFPLVTLVDRRFRRMSLAMASHPTRGVPPVA